MKIKFWQTNDFKRLQEYWHDKLKQSGFDDAEVASGSDWQLKQNATNAYRNKHELTRENKQRYYELIGIHLHAESRVEVLIVEPPFKVECVQFEQEVFKDDVERLIMERRSEGMPIRKICEELRALKERCHRQTVRLIIQKYEVKWKIKKG